MRIAKRRRSALVAVAGALLALGPAAAARGGATGPDAVKVTLAELAGSAWRAQVVGGRAVLERPASTLGFRDGGVHGSGGCNRFTGGVGEADDGLVLGPLASTRRMCPPAVMDQEQRFFDALGRAAGFERRGSDLVVLDREGAELARLVPLEGEA